MNPLFIRSAPLLGADAETILSEAHVAVFGLGGVGAACAEALCRAGIGHLTFVDGDCVSDSNLNRQLIALNSTLRQNKARAFCARALDINPLVKTQAIERFFTVNDTLPLEHFDFIADAIDDVGAKLFLIQRAKNEKIPLISAMGAAGKLDPSRFRVADLSETCGCPLAKKMRKELRAREILHLPVVFSPEEARVSLSPPASVSFVPPVAGFLMAGFIVRSLLHLS